MYEEARTQKQLVLEHMLAHGSITSRDAFIEYGITRLASVIWKLKNEDCISIDAKNETLKNRRGVNINFARYSLRRAEGKDA